MRSNNKSPARPEAAPSRPPRRLSIWNVTKPYARDTPNREKRLSVSEIGTTRANIQGAERQRHETAESRDIREVYNLTRGGVPAHEQQAPEVMRFPTPAGVAQLVEVQEAASGMSAMWARVRASVGAHGGGGTLAAAPAVRRQQSAPAAVTAGGRRRVSTRSVSTVGFKNFSGALAGGRKSTRWRRQSVEGPVAAAAERTATRRSSRVSSRSSTFIRVVGDCEDYVSDLLEEYEISPEAATVILPAFMRAATNYGLPSGKVLTAAERRAWELRCDDWMSSYETMRKAGSDVEAESVELERVDGSAMLLECAQRCDRLRDVSLRFGFLSDSALASLAVLMKGRLRLLDLHGTDGFTDAGLKAVAAHASEIETLRLGGCAVSDVSLTKVAKYCPKLRALQLTGGGSSLAEAVTAETTELLDGECLVERVELEAALLERIKAHEHEHGPYFQRLGTVTKPSGTADSTATAAPAAGAQTASSATSEEGAGGGAPPQLGGAASSSVGAEHADVPAVPLPRPAEFIVNESTKPRKKVELQLETAHTSDAKASRGWSPFGKAWRGSPSPRTAQAEVRL